MKTISCKILFLVLISSTFFVGYVSALKMEDLIGGHPVYHADLKYHAALVGKYNSSNVPYLICSAGIISDFFLVAAARCFMHTQTALKKLSFFAVIGVHILISKNINLKEISRIYMYYYRQFGVKHDIAVALLKEGLNLGARDDLVALEIPDIEENFYREVAFVAGFGLDSINDIKKQQNREQIRITTKHLLLLRYANVTIISGAPSYRNERSNIHELVCESLVIFFTDICGIIPPDETYDYRGVCMGDNGAPLVIGKKLIGVVSKHRRNCDDMKDGTIYTKVAKFKSFIDGLIRGIPIQGTFMYENPPHILQRNSGASSRVQNFTDEY